MQRNPGNLELDFLQKELSLIENKMDSVMEQKQLRENEFKQEEKEYDNLKKLDQIYNVN